MAVTEDPVAEPAAEAKRVSRGARVVLAIFLLYAAAVIGAAAGVGYHVVATHEHLHVWTLGPWSIDWHDALWGVAVGAALVAAGHLAVYWFEWSNRPRT